MLWNEEKIEGADSFSFSSVGLGDRVCSNGHLTAVDTENLCVISYEQHLSVLTGLPCQEHAVPSIHL